MRRERSILLLEGCKAVAPTARQILDAMGVSSELMCAAAAPETLNYLKTHAAEQPCVVLLEVDGSAGDGLATLRTLKEDERLRSIPVVVLGPSGDARMVNESFGLGAAGYIPKLPDSHELAGAVRTVCEYWALSELPRRGR